MSTKSERLMIKEAKRIGAEKSLKLKQEATEALQRAQKKSDIRKIEHKKKMELGNYLDKLFPNDIKKVQQIYKLVRSGELKSESDIDKYLGSKPDKSKLKSDIEKTIKDVKSHKTHKNINTKNVSDMIDISEMIVKTPKMPKVNKKDDMIDDIMSILLDIHESDKISKAQLKKMSKDDISEVLENLKKASQSKPKQKVMKQSEGYIHKVVDPSDRVQNYVNNVKSIILENKTPASITKALNKYKMEVMTNMKPSEISDANKLISDFRKTLPTKETKTKVYKTKAPKEPDTSYKGDKKYKPLTLYVKKHRPDVTSEDDIHMIVTELIDKKIPRMSVTKLKEIMKDLGYE